MRDANGDGLHKATINTTSNPKLFQYSTLNSNLIHLCEKNANANSLQLKTTAKTTNQVARKENAEYDNNSEEEGDDIDAALSKLEKTLEQVATSSNGHHQAAESQQSSSNDNEEKKIEKLQSLESDKHEAATTTSVRTELAENLLLMKQQKFTTFRKFKTYYFVLDSGHSLSYFKSSDEAAHGRPVEKLALKACELVPDVNVAAGKFGINVKVPSSVCGMLELCLRCPGPESYANWMSAIKLAARAKSMLLSLEDATTYANEVKSILNLLNMQQQAKKKASCEQPMTTGKLLYSSSSNTLNSVKNDSPGSTVAASYSSVSAASQVQATNLLPVRMLKKHKLKHVSLKFLSYLNQLKFIK